MIERVYGHLGTVRRRAKSVEYRVSHHKRTPGETPNGASPLWHRL